MINETATNAAIRVTMKWLASLDVEVAPGSVCMAVGHLVGMAVRAHDIEMENAILYKEIEMYRDDIKHAFAMLDEIEAEQREQKATEG